MGDPKEEGTLTYLHDYYIAWQSEPVINRTRLKIPLPEVEVHIFPATPGAMWWCGIHP